MCLSLKSNVLESMISGPTKRAVNFYSSDRKQIVYCTGCNQYSEQLMSPKILQKYCHNTMM